MGHDRTWLLGPLLAAVSVVVGVTAIEAGLRAWGALRASSSVATDGDNMGYALVGLHRPSPDAVLKYELGPGVTVRHRGVVYRTNAQALRGDRDVTTKAAGELRVMVLGDSVAFGLGVEEQDTFSRLLERQLVTQDGTVLVLNQSTLGYRTSQEVRRFWRDGRRLAPDVVILAFCLNDFDDFSGELPFFDSTTFERGATHSPPPRTLFGVDLSELVPFLDRLAVFRELTERFLRADYYGWIGRDGRRRSEVRKSLTRLGRYLREDEIIGVLAILPLLVDARPYPYLDIHEWLEQLAMRLGYHVVDLLAEAGTERLSGLRLSEYDVVHLNKRGHQLVADRLGMRLKQWLPRARNGIDGLAASP